MTNRCWIYAAVRYMIEGGLDDSTRIASQYSFDRSNATSQVLSQMRYPLRFYCHLTTKDAFLSFVSFVSWPGRLALNAPMGTPLLCTYQSHHRHQQSARISQLSANLHAAFASISSGSWWRASTFFLYSTWSRSHSNAASPLRGDELLTAC